MADTRSRKAGKVKKAPARKSSRRRTPKSPLLAKNAKNGAPGLPRGKQFLSDKVGHFTESVIREMTRQAMLYGAVNLAQGFPDFSAPAEMEQAAQQVVAAVGNQNPITLGRKKLGKAIGGQIG